MRIVSGIYKGRRFNPPANLKARPTTDIAKEGLFNILNNEVDFEEVCVLDMFGGTGNISLEFASRGCRDITLVEMNHVNYQFIKKVIAELDIEVINTIKGDSFKFIQKVDKQYDIIFADPPYDHKDLPNIPDLVFSKNLIAEGGMLILEHPRTYTFASHPHFESHRNYGHVNFSFFR